MKCPYCGEEMQLGCIQCRDGVYWSEKERVIAALNIGGSTIHRVFNVPAKIVPQGTRCYNRKRLEAISKADVIIIDEISMCRIDVFEYVARTLLYFKPRKQLLFVGDFYQLPPVLRNEDSGAFSQVYGDRLFAFESELWEKLELHTMELQNSMRQSDKTFVKALDNIREGHPDFSAFQTDKPADPNALTICGTNKEADGKNQAQMRNLVNQGAKPPPPPAAYAPTEPPFCLWLPLPPSWP